MHHRIVNVVKKHPIFPEANYLVPTYCLVYSFLCLSGINSRYSYQCSDSIWSNDCLVQIKDFHTKMQLIAILHSQSKLPSSATKFYISNFGHLYDIKCVLHKTVRGKWCHYENQVAHRSIIVVSGKLTLIANEVNVQWVLLLWCETSRKTIPVPIWKRQQLSWSDLGHL